MQIRLKMTDYAKVHPNWNKSKGPKIFANLAPSQDMSYLLGVLKGDGYVTKSGYQYHVCLQSISKNFVSSFETSLKNIGLHPCKIYRDGRGIYHSVACSLQFVDFYKNLKLRDLKQLIIGYQRHFIRGLYESEGSLFIKGQTNKFELVIVNSDLELLQIVKRYLFYKNIGSHIGKRGVTVNYLQMYLLRIYINDIQNFLDLINPCIKYISDNRIIKDY